MNQLKIIFFISLLCFMSIANHTTTLASEKDSGGHRRLCILFTNPAQKKVTRFSGNKNLQWIQKKIKIKKPYSTGDSLVVPYQSTGPAQRCLTSQFGWDAVLSPWYDRMTRSSEKTKPPVSRSVSRKRKKRSHTALEIPL